MNQPKKTKRQSLIERGYLPEEKPIQPIGTTASEIIFNPEKYEYLSYPTSTNQFADRLNELAQPTSDALTRGFVQAGYNMRQSFYESLSSSWFVNPKRAGELSSGYTGELSKTIFDTFAEEARKDAQTYQSEKPVFDKIKNGNFFQELSDPHTWSELMSTTGYTLGAIAPTMIDLALTELITMGIATPFAAAKASASLGKTIHALNKAGKFTEAAALTAKQAQLAKAVSTAKKLGKASLYTAITTPSEANTEAIQTYNDLMDKYTKVYGYSEEEARKFAAVGAAETWKYTAALAPIRALSYRFMTFNPNRGGPSMLDGAMKIISPPGLAKNKFFRRTIAPFVGEALTESAEEVWQYLGSKRGTELADAQAGVLNFTDNISDHLNDDELWFSAAAGAFGSTVTKSMGSVVSGVTRKVTGQKSYEEQMDVHYDSAPAEALRIKKDFASRIRNIMMTSEALDDKENGARHINTGTSLNLIRQDYLRNTDEFHNEHIDTLRKAADGIRSKDETVLKELGLDANMTEKELEGYASQFDKYLEESSMAKDAYDLYAAKFGADVAIPLASRHIEIARLNDQTASINYQFNNDITDPIRHEINKFKTKLNVLQANMPANEVQLSGRTNLAKTYREQIKKLEKQLRETIELEQSNLMEQMKMVHNKLKSPLDDPSVQQINAEVRRLRSQYDSLTSDDIYSQIDTEQDLTGTSFREVEAGNIVREVLRESLQEEMKIWSSAEFRQNLASKKYVTKINATSDVKELNAIERNIANDNMLVEELKNSIRAKVKEKITQVKEEPASAIKEKQNSQKTNDEEYSQALKNVAEAAKNVDPSESSNKGPTVDPAPQTEPEENTESVPTEEDTDTESAPDLNKQGDIDEAWLEEMLKKARKNKKSNKGSKKEETKADLVDDDVDNLSSFDTINQRIDDLAKIHGDFVKAMKAYYNKFKQKNGQLDESSIVAFVLRDLEEVIENQDVFEIAEELINLIWRADMYSMYKGDKPNTRETEIGNLKKEEQVPGSKGDNKQGVMQANTAVMVKFFKQLFSGDIQESFATIRKIAIPQLKSARLDKSFEDVDGVRENFQAIVENSDVDVEYVLSGELKEGDEVSVTFFTEEDSDKNPAERQMVYVHNNKIIGFVHEPDWYGTIDENDNVIPNNKNVAETEHQKDVVRDAINRLNALRQDVADNGSTTVSISAITPGYINTLEEAKRVSDMSPDSTMGVVKTGGAIYVTDSKGHRELSKDEIVADFDLLPGTSVELRPVKHNGKHKYLVLLAQPMTLNQRKKLHEGIGKALADHLKATNKVSSAKNLQNLIKPYFYIAKSMSVSVENHPTILIQKGDVYFKFKNKADGSVQTMKLTEENLTQFINSIGNLRFNISADVLAENRKIGGANENYNKMMTHVFESNVESYELSTGQRVSLFQPVILFDHKKVAQPVRADVKPATTQQSNQTSTAVSQKASVDSDEVTKKKQKLKADLAAAKAHLKNINFKPRKSVDPEQDC